MNAQKNLFRFQTGFFRFDLRLFLLLLTFGDACEARRQPDASAPLTKTRTILDERATFGEPFGVAVKNGAIFFSDGAAGAIRRVGREDRSFAVVAEKLDTPSGIAFDKNGDLIVADTGAHTIKRVNIATGAVETLAGVEHQTGFADGAARAALFNAPVGVAVSGDKIFVADTYNDRIRVIENGAVSTVAGGAQGFADAETGAAAQFDTPCGLAIWKDVLLVADAGNRRLRAVEATGKTRTLAGGAAADAYEPAADGTLSEARFSQPLAVAVDRFGTIYVADGNAIRAVGRRFFPLVETLTARRRGFADGDLRSARFNRPSGLAADPETGDLYVADADNRALRVLTGADNRDAAISPAAIEKMRGAAADFRSAGAPRWTFDPPRAAREIAGTLGEIRGEIADENSFARFHNGLDVAGDYGETARFVRGETVLHPLAAENFNTSRELLRMPTLGYIHIRLGRDQTDKLFDDRRFQFTRDAETGKLKNVRVPRGARFQAGEAVGTLNAMNHVHLIAGRAGAEINALAALELPGIADRIAPVVETVALYDENWQPVSETAKPNARINLAGKTRVVVQAYDRMDGNAERRRLGVYKIGYQILRADGATPVSETDWTISFDRNPDADAARYVYASGSKSGATGATIFRYIATNRVNGDEFREDFLDAGKLENGEYILRVFAADYFGNQTARDVRFFVLK